MARNKVKLAFITNDAARKASFRKRRKGLMKKVSELSTLCGVPACAIVYSPYEPTPEVWPSQEEAKQILERLSERSETEQKARMVDQESFLEKRLEKMTEMLEKEKRANREKELTQTMYSLLIQQGVQDLKDDENVMEIQALVEKKLRETDHQKRLASQNRSVQES